MADAPTPANSNEPKKDPREFLTSFFAGDKQIPSTSFYGYLAGGIATDVLAFWLPGAGDVFIGYCRGMYWLNGYKTDKMGMATAINMAVEAIPVLEALPCATAFVLWSYSINVAETKAGEALTAQVATKMNAYVAERAAAKSIGEGLKGFGGAGAAPAGGVAGGVAPTNSGAQKNQNTGYEQRNPGGSMASAPTSAADKNTGYAGNKSVDGIGYNPGRLPQAANSNEYDTATNDNTPEPTRLRNPDDQNVGYREAA